MKTIDKLPMLQFDYSTDHKTIPLFTNNGSGSLAATAVSAYKDVNALKLLVI